MVVFLPQPQWQYPYGIGSKESCFCFISHISCRAIILYRRRYVKEDSQIANHLYPYGRESYLDGTLDFDANTIRITLIDTDLYKISGGSVHRFYGKDIAIGARIKESDSQNGAMVTKTTTSGIADGGNMTLSAVSGDAFSAIVIWQDSGSPDTSRLICYLDTGTGLPASPNSGDIEIVFSNAASKIFQL